MMYRTSNVINPNTNSNPVKLQNQIQQQKNFFNLINLDNSTGTAVNSGTGVITSLPSDSGGKHSDDMKTENVMVTTVKVEPINYTVANNQQYNENMYTKRPRLER